MDHQIALAAAQTNGGFVTEKFLREQKGWSQHRVDRAIKKLLQAGMVWIDLPTEDPAVDATSEPEVLYWFPTLFEDDDGDSSVRNDAETATATATNK